MFPPFIFAFTYSLLKPTAAILSAVGLNSFSFITEVFLPISIQGNEMHSENMYQVLKAESLVENYFGNLIYFHLQVNSYSAFYHVWWKTWTNSKEIQMYTI
jgi:high-affinity K+ transport system ATPase subunit B